MGTCVETAVVDTACGTKLDVAARHQFSAWLKVRLCTLKEVCFSLLLKTSFNGDSTATSVNLFQCISILFKVFLISNLNLSNCHCCNYFLIHYFSPFTSCPIHHEHGNCFISFLCTTAGLYLKDAVVSQLRLPLSLNNPSSFSLYLQIVISKQLISFDPHIWYVPGCSRSSWGHTGDVTSPVLNQQVRITSYVYKVTQQEISAFWVCQCLLGPQDGHRPMCWAGTAIPSGLENFSIIYLPSHFQFFPFSLYQV